MFSKTVRYAAYSVIAVAAFFLALGALLLQAAIATGAASNYNVSVSWLSALSSAIWPMSLRLALLLLGVLLLAILSLLIFFRGPKGIGVALFFVQAAIAFYCGGALGLFFISREFETYHFGMDGEKLGEYWFVFEAVAIWTFAAATLAVIRIFARKPLATEAR